MMVTDEMDNQARTSHKFTGLAIENKEIKIRKSRIVFTSPGTALKSTIPNNEYMNVIIDQIPDIRIRQIA